MAKKIIHLLSHCLYDVYKRFIAQYSSSFKFQHTKRQADAIGLQILNLTFYINMFVFKTFCLYLQHISKHKVRNNVAYHTKTL